MDQTLRERKKRIIAVLIVHLELLNNLTLVLLMICSALLLQQLKKNKRRKLWNCHSRQLVMDESVGEIEAEYEAESQVSLTETTSQGGMGSSSTQKQKKRKRANKTQEVLDKLAEAIDKIGRTSSNIRELVSCFKHEKETAERRMNLHALLKGIDGLTVKQRVRAGIIIAKNNNLTDLIFSIAPEERLEFVLVVLAQSS